MHFRVARLAETALTGGASMVRCRQRLPEIRPAPREGEWVWNLAKRTLRHLVTDGKDRPTHTSVVST